MSEEFREEFARESEEQITELNNALLSFESDPTDETAMEQIFRTAHTLKSNCGAMGFDDASAIAHAIEDLLEAVKSGRVSVTPELMDAVFEGVDELEAAIGEAARHGAVRRDPDDVIETLREYAESQGLSSPADAEVDSLLENAASPTKSDHSVYHVRLTVAGDPRSHGRAVVDALEDAFELLGTDPDRETIGDGDYDGTFDALFASVVERSAVDAALRPVDAVADHVVTDVTDRVQTPAGTGQSSTGADSDPVSTDDELDPDEVSVDELLSTSDVDQFDDLDELAADVEDASEFDDIEEAGSFADLGFGEDDVEVGSDTDDGGAADADDTDAARATADDTDGATATADDTDADPDDADAASAANGSDSGDEVVQDATAEFQELKDEVDPVGFDELQEEIEELEFDEYDSDDEVGFDELLGEETLADESEFGATESIAESADSEATATESASDGKAASPSVDADESVDTDDADAERVTDAVDADVEATDTEPADGEREPADVEAEPVETDAEPVDVDAEPAAADAEPTDVEAEPAEADAEDVGDSTVDQPETADPASDQPETADPASDDETVADSERASEDGLDTVDDDTPAEPVDAPAETADEAQSGPEAADAAEDASTGEQDAQQPQDATAADLFGSPSTSEEVDPSEADDASVAAAEASDESTEANDDPTVTDDDLASTDDDPTATEADASDGSVEATGDAVDSPVEVGDDLTEPADAETTDPVADDATAVADASGVTDGSDAPSVGDEYDDLDDPATSEATADETNSDLDETAEIEASGDDPIDDVEDTSVLDLDAGRPAGTDDATDEDDSDAVGDLVETAPDTDADESPVESNSVDHDQPDVLESDSDEEFDPGAGRAFGEADDDVEADGVDAPADDAVDDADDLDVDVQRPDFLDDRTDDEFDSDAGRTFGDTDESAGGDAEAADTGVDDADETVEAASGDADEHGVSLDRPDVLDSGTDDSGVDLDAGSTFGDDDDVDRDQSPNVGDLSSSTDDLLSDDEDDGLGLDVGSTGSLDGGIGGTDLGDRSSTADSDGSIEDPGFRDTSEQYGDAVVDDVDEDRLERIRSLGVPDRDGTDDGAGESQSVRVDVDQLDDMLNLVEGLVTSRARLRRALEEDEPTAVLEEEVDDLEDVTSELQDAVMDVRLVPLRRSVSKLPRTVRDVAREQNKEVDFELSGEDVELDRSVLEEIGDPLVHLVRNAVDHGIELPEERAEAGKDETGSVRLTARRERDRVVVSVEDDGRGIDPDDLRDAAVEEDVYSRAEVDAMDDDEAMELVFHPGLSTAEEVTDVSGRGVGMDVVAETVEKLDGSVSVDSEPGEGTTVELELPVTLAIAEMLFLEVGGEEYGIPVDVVSEIGPVVDVETQNGQEVLVSDGGEDERELIRLDEALGTEGRIDTGQGMLVHLRSDVREAALLCDGVRGQQEIVVKPFEGVLAAVPGIAGATVLGDGDVVNILDPESL